jgi:hypothetical protein
MVRRTVIMERRRLSIELTLPRKRRKKPEEAKDLFNEFISAFIGRASDSSVAKVLHHGTNLAAEEAEKV